MQRLAGEKYGALGCNSREVGVYISVQCHRVGVVVWDGAVGSGSRLIRSAFFGKGWFFVRGDVITGSIYNILAHSAKSGFYSEKYKAKFLFCEVFQIGDLLGEIGLCAAPTR